MNQSTGWTIAGSDSSAQAGIQADLLTFHHLNVQACTIITAVTAQNANKISAIYSIPTNQIQAQLAILKQTDPPKAIKIGMLGNINTLKVINELFREGLKNIIVDPVMVSTSGYNLITTKKNVYLKKLLELFPYIDLLTPNIPEAETILQRKICTYEDMVIAAHEIVSLGVKSVIIKGGHIKINNRSQDYWTNGQESFWLSSHRYLQKNYRGTGCIFSSAVTAALARGYELKDALVIAKMYINQGIRLAIPQTNDVGYFQHVGWPEEEVDLPNLLNSPNWDDAIKFKKLGEETLGLYPIVDNSHWLKILLPLGIKTIQLRIKNKNGVDLENEIKNSIKLAKQYRAKLFINDYWELAIAHNAYGVHLGQDDINTADIKKIYTAGLRLGISTHCYYEVARAHTYRPSYMACGPIFKTTSKIMPFLPQGLDQLRYWRKLLRNYSLVAIGGINNENLGEILNIGVDGIAMISAITKSENPIQKTLKLLSMMEGE